MTGDPYSTEEAAHIIQPEPPPRNTRGGRLALIIAVACCGLLILSGIVTSAVNAFHPPPVQAKPITMTHQQATDFGAQQGNQAKFFRGMDSDEDQRHARNQLLGQAMGIDPIDSKPAAAQVQPVSAPSGPSLAEQELMRRLQEAERRRQADLDASPLAVDFGSFFSTQDKLAKQSAAAGIPTSREAYDKAEADAAEQRMTSPIAEAINAATPTTGTDLGGRAIKEPHDPKKDYSFDSANGKLFRLMEGHVLETVLVNRLGGASAGPVVTMTTADIWSASGAHLLIPKGSRLLGTVTAVGSLNQERLFVAFHRVIMPDGYSVSLDKFQGLDVVGQTGLRDLVNHHYTQIFGASLALAAVAATSQIGNNSGFGAYNFDTQMRANMSQEMGQSAQRVMERFLNILPTFTIRERSRIKIMLSGDLLLPDNNNHTMDKDL